MFERRFQGGTSVEILSSSGRDPLESWRISSKKHVKKIYAKDVRGFIFECGGYSQGKMVLPGSERESLGLIQPFLVLQVQLSNFNPFSLAISMRGASKTKHRVILSTNFKDISITPLHVQLPLTIVKRGIWLNLCLDLESIMTRTFKTNFRCLDSIEIRSYCQIRRIFTMRSPPHDDTDDQEIYGWTPSYPTSSFISRSHNFPVGVTFKTQIYSMEKISLAHSIVERSARISKSRGHSRAVSSAGPRLKRRPAVLRRQRSDNRGMDERDRKEGNEKKINEKRVERKLVKMIKSGRRANTKFRPIVADDEEGKDGNLCDSQPRSRRSPTSEIISSRRNGEHSYTSRFSPTSTRISPGSSTTRRRRAVPIRKKMPRQLAPIKKSDEGIQQENVSVKRVTPPGSALKEDSTAPVGNKSSRAEFSENETKRKITLNRNFKNLGTKFADSSKHIISDQLNETQEMSAGNEKEEKLKRIRESISPKKQVDLLAHHNGFEFEMENLELESARPGDGSDIWESKDEEPSLKSDDHQDPGELVLEDAAHHSEDWDAAHHSEDWEVTSTGIAADQEACDIENEKKQDMGSKGGSKNIQNLEKKDSWKQSELQIRYDHNVAFDDKNMFTNTETVARPTTSSPADGFLAPLNFAHDRLMTPPLHLEGLTEKDRNIPGVLDGRHSPIRQFGLSEAEILSGSSFGPNDKVGAKQPSIGNESKSDMVKLLYDPVLECYYDPNSNKYFQFGS